jgi:hypothetical protein
MADDPYTDDEYDDTYKEAHGDEPTRDQYTDGATDDTFLPSGVGDTMAPSGWGIWPSNEPDADERTTAATGGTTGSDDGSWLDEGLIGTFLLVGVILFFFPEPATTLTGIVMILVGAAAWVVDWAL